MEVKPVMDYSGPEIPTRTILDEHPELLQLVPKRWQKNPAVLAALTMACVAFAGCKGANAADSPEPPRLAGVPMPPPSAKVAPIFLHGDGRGTFAGKVINPPVILPEDEARQVIIEEAKKAGLRFRAGGKTLNGVPVLTGYGEQQAIKMIDLKLDGTDAKRDISFEYVTQSDAAAWNLSEISPIGAAKLVRQGLSETRTHGTYAVFYDPGLRGNEQTIRRTQDRRAYEARTKKAAREELRKQVRDFIKWLKGQGVI